MADKNREEDKDREDTPKNKSYRLEIRELLAKNVADLESCSQIDDRFEQYLEGSGLDANLWIGRNGMTEIGLRPTLDRIEQYLRQSQLALDKAVELLREMRNREE